MDRLLATDRAEFASVPCVSARVASSPAPAAIGDAGFSVPALKGCRVCLDLRYASQNMGEVDRVWRQIGKITRRVDPATTILSRDEFPEKPKRMRWRTYQRLMYRHAAQVNRLFDVAVHAVSNADDLA